MIGLDADMCGIDARVDPWPVTHRGELLAALSGKKTYELDIRGHLHRRGRWRLRKPAKTVMAEHRCEEPLEKAWLDLSPCTPPAGARGDDDDVAPF
jgi:hypothetical protein